jgi:hypothetical protein
MLKTPVINIVNSNDQSQYSLGQGPEGSRRLRLSDFKKIGT